MTDFLPARWKTEPFAPGLPPRKGGSARSKHAPERIRPPVASAQRSRRHSARSARLEGECRDVSPSGVSPASSWFAGLDGLVALPGWWRAVSAHERIPTDYHQNFAR